MCKGITASLRCVSHLGPLTEKEERRCSLILLQYIESWPPQVMKLS